MKAIVSLLDGLPLRDPKAQIELTFDDENLIISEKGFSGLKSVVVSKFNIPLKNIKDTLLTTEKEFLEKNKSAIGRGVVGGIFFGPAGLVLGGLSGVGKKKASKKSYLYIVSYESVSGDIKNITFTMPMMMQGVTRKFDSLLRANNNITTADIEQSEFYL